LVKERKKSFERLGGGEGRARRTMDSQPPSYLEGKGGVLKKKADRKEREPGPGFKEGGGFPGNRVSRKKIRHP